IRPFPICPAELLVLPAGLFFVVVVLFNRWYKIYAIY
ncbi:unnamed protein product, partial [marine sediment metagenome]